MQPIARPLAFDSLLLFAMQPIARPLAFDSLLLFAMQPIVRPLAFDSLFLFALQPIVRPLAFDSLLIFTRQRFPLHALSLANRPRMLSAIFVRLLALVHLGLDSPFIHMSDNRCINRRLQSLAFAVYIQSTVRIWCF